MRKTTFLLLFAISLTFTSVFAQNVIIKGANGIADNTSFETLKAAIDALNANPDQTAHDVEILIAGNTTEPANFGLAVNTGTKKITIRPDADADRTITFTQTAANAGPVGNFVIGYLTNGLASAIDDSYYISTNNVIIDGYSEGGTTKRLKLTTSNASLATSSLVTVFGGCENTTIKNCILENNSTASTPRCIYYYVRKGTSIDVSPNNLTIENNYIKCMASTTGQGISGVNSGASPVSRATNMTIKNNYVIAQGRCMEIHYFGAGLNVIGNEIKLSQQGNSGTTNYGLWVRTGVGPINIIGNKFTETSTKEAGASGTLGTRAISCSAYEHNIYNNMFSGMDRSGTASVSVSQAYIFVVGTGRIYHNTFYMPALSSPTTPGTYQAINNSTSLNVEIKNNIFISNEDVKSQFVSNVNNISENNIYFLRAGNTNAKIVSTYSTLLAYQTANPTKDINSKSVNVNFVDAAAGDLRIAPASYQDANLQVDRLADVLKDIFGVDRDRYTYAGAHQAETFIINSNNKLSENGIRLINTLSGIEVVLNSESAIELYNANGILIDKTRASGVYRRSLNKGIYIININGVALKFIK